MTSIKLGYSLSLTGPLAANGQTARLAHEIWRANVNGRGGLLGREVELICIDDRTNAASVAEIYRKLLTEQSVDLLLGGYGNNSISPAMPVAMENHKFFVGLMGLGVNNALAYDRYFAMIPTGPDPNTALTAGFFDTASQQNPKPQTVAIVAADADFTRNPIAGARANAKRCGLDVGSETKYSLATQDFSAVLKELTRAPPDILFFCSYLNDSVGLIRALSESDLNPLVVGGAMIGPQSTAVQSQLGSAVNGVINYEYWLPTPAMDFPGVRQLIGAYQEQAKGTGADALGYYVAPLAYAQVQVIEQAIQATGSLDDATLAEYTRAATFSTVVGKVKFGRLGEWASPRVLTVQFRNVGSREISEFSKPGARIVVAPAEYASGNLVVPFREAAKAGA
jgi:branched-chain amino acid transport system substrate-binding protein